MVVGHDGLQGASDDFGEKRDKTAMLFNENFPGKKHYYDTKEAQRIFDGGLAAGLITE